MKNRGIKKIKNILFLIMTVIIILGIYINIRNSKAEETNSVLLKIEDIEGKISEQRISLIATENEDGTYNVKIPERTDINKITNFYTEKGEQLKFKITEDAVNLILTKEEIENNEINIKALYTDGNTEISNMIKRTDTENEHESLFLENENLQRRYIKNLTFLNDLSEDNINEETKWDVSALQDESVIAWYDGDAEEGFNVYIYSPNGIIYANNDSSYLFAWMTMCLKINGLNNLNTSRVIDMHDMFMFCECIESLDVSSFNTSSVTNMKWMFFSCKALTELNVSSFDTSNVTNMLGMFKYCSNLENLDVSNFNTSGVVNMGSMFAGCYDLVSLNFGEIDTSNATNMEGMFHGCTCLEHLDVKSFDTSNVTDMGLMFGMCMALSELDVSNFDTSNVTDMGSMFIHCKNLRQLDLTTFNTSKVKHMAMMFEDCISLEYMDIRNFDFNVCLNMMGMFYGCSNLKEVIVGNYNTLEENEDIYMSAYCDNMFGDCINLMKIDLKNMPPSVNFKKNGMFRNCSSIKELYFGKYFTVMGECNDWDSPPTDVFDNCGTVGTKIYVSPSIFYDSTHLKLYEESTKTIEITTGAEFVPYGTELNEIELKSETYTIDLENSEYIKEIEEQTEAKDFLNNIETNAESIVIKDKEGRELNGTEIVGTGMTIDFNNGEQVLTIVVTGDINGDGKVTASDVSNLKSALIGKKTLEGAYKEAGDLKEDGEIKTSDLARLKKMIIGL